MNLLQQLFSRYRFFVALVFCICFVITANGQAPWQSVHITPTGNKLQYHPDSLGNIIPDFSGVGYMRGMSAIPQVPVVKTIMASGSDDGKIIQQAIDQVASMPAGKNGFRGAILLKKGTYYVEGTIHVNVPGMVLRGEGGETILVARGNVKHTLLAVTGTGSPTEIAGTRKKIKDTYVPTGAKSFQLHNVEGLKVGDRIMVLRPGTAKWISDLQMDKILPKEDTKQWTPKEYDLKFERIITKISGNKIFLDNPVVMALDRNYGGGEIYRYTFDGRISNCGIENIYLRSEYESDTAENHGWDAVSFNRVENGWVRNVTAQFFGYSCVNLGNFSKWITVDYCTSLDPKSIITGGRRYSFNNDGQMNLVMNCHASGGRHDYVTGAQVCGPNVFYNCTAEKTHADIGPHHRWAVGTLYDNIVTDGEINVQDRGNWGTGHGWAGATQVIWNCTALRAAIQDPWVSAKNYCIGLQAIPYDGRLKGRRATIWEGRNKKGLVPGSLFLAQLKDRKEKGRK
jgi:hypothetical protein